MRLTMPDGTPVWARVAVVEESQDDGPSDVGIIDRTALLGLREALSSVASNVRTGLKAASPDHVSVEFGLEFALTDSGVVAAIVGLSGNATVKVTASWGNESPAAGGKPDGDQSHR